MAAALVATAPTLYFARELINDTKAEIEAGRLHLAQLVATQADRLLTEAFFELELLVESLAIAPDGKPTRSETQILRTGRSSSFIAGVMLLDSEVEIVLAEPATAATGTGIDEILKAAALADDRTVSQPWLDPQTGHVMSALGLPVYDRTGGRQATMVALLDLSEPLVTDLIEPAAGLGPSGHADLVDERGLVLASTHPGHVLTAGDHPDFYTRMAQLRTSSVERVAAIPEPQSLDRSPWHLMAYAPLRNAPWGVALGANEEETLRTVWRLQHRLIVLGLAASATLLLGAGLAMFQVPDRSSEERP
ncbi:MAG: cache domain-containing protein [Acidimicrobiia bacterium]